MNPLNPQSHFLRSYPPAAAIIAQEDGDASNAAIPDVVRQCACVLTTRGAGSARFCVASDAGALFELAGYYLSVLADGTILDGEDVLQEALTAGVIADAQGDAPTGLVLPATQSHDNQVEQATQFDLFEIQP